MSPSARTDAVTVTFESTLERVAETTLVRLPAAASKRLPSRGQIAMRGTMNGRAFDTVLEPDGAFGHWMRIDRRLARGLTVGERVAVTLGVADAWPEPSVPSDLAAALASAPMKVRAIWKGTTPMARWEWVRWVNATKNPDTRARRVEVSISKMKSGKRRPCCFDLSSCTDPDVAKNGKLPG